MLCFILNFSYTGYLLQVLLWTNGVFLMFFVLALFLSPENKARKLISSLPKRELILNEKGLSIPIEMVTDPPFNIAVRASKTEIQLAWSHIVDWEVSGGSGDDPSQYQIRLKGIHQYGGFLFQTVGLIRTPEILRNEKNLIKCLREHLACPIKWSTSEPDWMTSPEI